jgi:uncharacterized protein with FMN-binding domain
MKDQGGGSGNKIANNLVALSSAAILTVYAAGYLRTRTAADRFTVPAAQRRFTVPPESDATGLVGVPGQAPSAAEGIPQRPAAPSTRTAPSPQPSAISPEAPSAPRPSVQTPVHTPAETTAQIDAAAVSPSAAPAPLINDATVAQGVHPATDATAAQTPAPEVHYKDGTFSGWGYCRHGDIQATVVVENGKLVAAGITQCLTRYPCSWIEKLPPQVVARQSADVDYVSGATESADAFSDAVVDALTKAR